jgi:hypothetical protein
VEYPMQKNLLTFVNRFGHCLTLEVTCGANELPVKSRKPFRRPVY